MRSLALRNLLVTTAICAATSEDKGEGSYREVVTIAKQYINSLIPDEIERARVYEGLARSQLFLGKADDSLQERIPYALEYIEKAKILYWNGSMIGENSIALVEIQIARTCLEIYVHQSPKDEDKISILLGNFTESLRPGFDRYIKELRRLAVMSGSLAIVQQADILIKGITPAKF